MNLLLTRFFLALSFFTRLPVPNLKEFREEDFGKSLLFLPLVGLIIGFLLVLAASFFSWLLPLTLLIPLLLSLQIYLTGAITVDGFMDTFDGIFSGRKPERILEIMRDSRVGAHAVVSVMMLLLLKLGALASLPVQPGSIAFALPLDLWNWNFQTGFYGSTFDPLLLTLLWLPMVGRWSIAFALYRFPYARSEGMAALFHRHRPVAPVFITTLFTAFVLTALAGLVGIFILAMTALFVQVWATHLSKKLGGLTGDIYGAICETVEVYGLVLLVALLYSPFGEVLF
ncbi:adenosylcobinamide-GDP ribazoletransferase [Heliorestis convoluta]|uniref:Adenosylcobinamide-GDP ribazoletransferase n=1 Tax=Heliorestis convoluta TaxID=356322 RepID=A0A5Q2MZJ1_9FIRM|nr:adenosylcobinamide-GDP ribazoletransferase [Heliorestis convoluta]QGG46889.1 cobalamin 5'-phosphate synthase [Heliorestis convoluta]